MKKLKSWNITFAAFGGLIGMIFGSFIFNAGDLSAILGAATGFVIIFVINAVYVKSKKDKTPELDERTRGNMRTYYAIIGNVFMAFLFFGVTVLTYLGEDQVSISYLFIFVIAYMVISGVGALIVSKR